MARADRLTGGEIAFHDLAEDFARALVELREAYLRGTDGNVVGHKGSCRAEICPSPRASASAKKAYDDGPCPRRRRHLQAGRPFYHFKEMHMRPSRRQPDELRAVSLERGVVK